MDIETFLAEAREKMRLQPWEKEDKKWRRYFPLPPGFGVKKSFRYFTEIRKAGFDGIFLRGFGIKEGDYLYQDYPRPGGVWEATEEICEECGAELEVEITVSEKGIEYEGRLRCPTGCLPK